MNTMKITIAAAAIITAMTAGARSAQTFSFEGRQVAGTTVRAMLAAQDATSIPKLSMPANKSLIETHQQHLSYEDVNRKLYELASLRSALVARRINVSAQLDNTHNPELRAFLTKQLEGIDVMRDAARKDYAKLLSLGYDNVTIPSQAQYDAMLARLPALNAERTAIENRITELELASASEKDPAVLANLIQTYKSLTKELARLKKEIDEINSWK